MTHPAVPAPSPSPGAGDGLARAWPAALLLVAALLFAVRAEADDPVTKPDGTITSHGLSIFGDLKYPADFKHFDYVNPDAPKGGTFRTWDLGSYDSLTPFTEKGDAAATAWIVFDSLMVSSLDSLDQMYGLIAESVTYPPDKQWVSFKMRPEARFADGSPLTAEDVVFTFDMMKTKGQLRYRAYFGDIEKVEALGPHEVKVTFRQGAAGARPAADRRLHRHLLQGLLRRTATSPAPRWTRRSAPAPTRSRAPTPAAR